MTSADICQASPDIMVHLTFRTLGWAWRISG
jgi:hypothetical protein